MTSKKKSGHQEKILLSKFLCGDGVNINTKFHQHVFSGTGANEEEDETDPSPR